MPTVVFVNCTKEIRCKNKLPLIIVDLSFKTVQIDGAKNTETLAS